MEMKISFNSRIFLSLVTNLTKLSMSTAGAVFISLGTRSIAQSATFINTINTPVDSFIGVFGEAVDFSTAGQTFTVPEANSILTDFTFFVQDYSYPSEVYPDDNSDVVDFRAFVTQYDDTSGRLIGSILYESETRSTTVGGGTERFTFNTGGINLTSGKKYAAFLSASKDFDGIPGGASIGYTGSADADIYPEGGLFVVRNGADFSRLFSEVIPTGGIDWAFEATFISPIAEPIPEPNAITGLSLLGVLGLGFLLKKRLTRCL
jgi:hypothetical protein